MPVAAPADKRFRRAHVHPAKKRRWMPSWKTVAVAVTLSAVVLYGVFRAAGVALTANALSINTITVDGTSRMAPGEALAILEGLRGSSMVTADLESWRQKLLMSPWVSDASIRRVFPGTLAVAIKERQPIGIGRTKGTLYLIDKTGTVIDEFGPNYADLDLPIIDGLSPNGEDAGQSVDEGRAALAGRLMSELASRPKLAGQVSQIDVTDSRNAIVLLKGDTALLRVGDERFTERLQAYLDLMPALRERMPDIDYVDLRFDERVYVRPQGSRLRAVGAPAGQAGSHGKRAPARRGG